MSNGKSQSVTLSLVRVLKELSREWKSAREREPDASVSPSERVKSYLALPVFALIELVRDATSIPTNDLEWVVAFIDTPLQLTPWKNPEERLHPNFIDSQYDGLPYDKVSGTNLNYLRSLHDELHKCDADGRTAVLLRDLEADHPGVLDALRAEEEQRRAAPYGETPRVDSAWVDAMLARKAKEDAAIVKAKQDDAKWQERPAARRAALTQALDGLDVTTGLIAGRNAGPEATSPRLIAATKIPWQDGKPFTTTFAYYSNDPQYESEFRRVAREILTAAENGDGGTVEKWLYKLAQLNSDFQAQVWQHIAEFLGGQSVEQIDACGTSETPPVESLSFIEAGCQLLHGTTEYLPLPRTDGFEDDVYWTKADYSELCGIVCSRLAWVTAKDWWDADNVQRAAYMRAAIAAETKKDRDGSLADTTGQSASDETVAKARDKQLAVLRDFLWMPAAERSLTSGFKGKAHDDLLRLLQPKLDEGLGGSPRSIILQSLRDDGCDLLIIWGVAQKYGIQLKSYFDISERDFEKNTLAQIQRSRAHGLRRLYVLLAGDMANASQEQKVRGFEATVSKQNDEYVITVSPERVWTLLFGGSTEGQDGTS